MTTLNVDVVKDAERMLKKAAERLHQLSGVMRNTDTLSQDAAKRYHTEAVANIHAALARIEG